MIRIWRLAFFALILSIICICFPCQQTTLAKQTPGPTFLPPISLPANFSSSLIFSGAGNTMWILGSQLDTILLMTSPGTFHQYSYWNSLPPEDSSFTNAFTSNPASGAFWFTAYPDVIGRLTPDGKIRSFHVQMPQYGGRAEGIFQIFYDPHGRLWYVSDRGDHFGWMDIKTGKLHDRIVGNSCSVRDFAIGYDGDLWFIDGAMNSIDHLTTRGSILSYKLPPAPYYIDPRNRGWDNPLSLIRGPQHSLWFLEANTGQIAKITETGQITEYPVGNSLFFGLIAGSDGNIWMGRSDIPALVRITPQGISTQYSVPNARDAVRPVLMGKDHILWLLSGNGILEGLRL